MATDLNASTMNPVAALRYECRGAFHADHGGASRFVYDPRCQSCFVAHGAPVDLADREEVEKWLST